MDKTAEDKPEGDQPEVHHAPKPETVDQTKSTVTAEQAAAMDKAAPQPNFGEEAVGKEDKDHSKSDKSHPSHSKK
jgi:hypothetical protein